jgi:hypothetical protein
MKKGIITMMIATALAAGNVISAYAFGADDLVRATENNFSVADGSLYGGNGKCDPFWIFGNLDQMLNAGGGRDVSASEMIELNYNDDYVWSVPAYKIADLSARQDKIDVWMKKNVSGIIPSGVEHEEAIRLAYDYIMKSLEYDYNIEKDVDEECLAQGADYVIDHGGKGDCASFSRFFRALVEAIPFDSETGLVNYDVVKEHEYHIRVAIISFNRTQNDGHVWTAIQDPDGDWYHYDVAMEMIKNRSYYHINSINIIGDGLHANQSLWTWLY